MPNYVYNIDINDPSFYTPSLKRAAEISYQEKQYVQAFQYFNQLKETTVNEDELNEVHWWILSSAYKLDSISIVLSEAYIYWKTKGKICKEKIK